MAPKATDKSSTGKFEESNAYREQGDVFVSQMLANDGTRLTSESVRRRSRD
jgi:hypothetical protein